VGWYLVETTRFGFGGLCHGWQCVVAMTFCGRLSLGDWVDPGTEATYVARRKLMSSPVGYLTMGLGQYDQLYDYASVSDCWEAISVLTNL
jgi:hypothetical protein